MRMRNLFQASVLAGSLAFFSWPAAAQVGPGPSAGGTPVPDGTPVVGTITSSQSVTLTTPGGYGTYGFQISGTWTGLLIIEGTVDGTNWFPTTAVPLNSSAVGAFTANNAGQGSLAGLAGIRFRGSTVGSGTATVTLRPSLPTSAIMQDNLHWSTNIDQINGTAPSQSNPMPSTAYSSGAITNPTSTLTRPANTTAYAAGQTVASSTTAGSAVIPSFAIPSTAGGAIVSKAILTTNVTAGWGGAAMRIDLWRTAPTYTNGDGGAYSIATGTSGYLGSMACTFTQGGDGAYADCAPVTGSAILLKLAAGTAVYWTSEINSVATPISGQTFTLTPELLN